MSKHLHAREEEFFDGYTGLLPIGPGTPVIVGVDEEGKPVEGKFVKIVDVPDNGEFVMVSRPGEKHGVKGVVLDYIRPNKVVFIEEEVVEIDLEPDNHGTVPRLKRRVSYE